LLHIIHSVFPSTDTSELGDQDQLHITLHRYLTPECWVGQAAGKANFQVYQVHAHARSVLTISITHARLETTSL